LGVNKHEPERLEANFGQISAEFEDTESSQLLLYTLAATLAKPRHKDPIQRPPWGDLELAARNSSSKEQIMLKMRPYALLAVGLAFLSVSASAQESPLTLAKHGYFFVGGQYVQRGRKEVMDGQMYVE